MWLTRVYSLFSSGRVKPVLYTEVFPLNKIPEGLGKLEQRKTWGKAVVRVREEDSTKAKL